MRHQKTFAICFLSPTLRSTYQSTGFLVRRRSTPARDHTEQLGLWNIHIPTVFLLQLSASSLSLLDLLLLFAYIFCASLCRPLQFWYGWICVQSLVLDSSGYCRVSGIQSKDLSGYQFANAWKQAVVFRLFH